MLYWSLVAAAATWPSLMRSVLLQSWSGSASLPWQKHSLGLTHASAPCRTNRIKLILLLTTVLYLRLYILMHYLRLKMSWHLQICTIITYRSMSYIDSVNMTTWKLTEHLKNRASNSSRNFTSVVLLQNSFYRIGPWLGHSQ